MTANDYLEIPVLFFLYDKGDVMKHDDLIGICSSFYNEEEICETKRILYRFLE